MLLRNFLWTLVFTTTAAIASLQTSPPPDHHHHHQQQHPQALLLSRLERMESLMADHQSQFQREREQWQREHQTLREDFQQLLQRERQDVRAEMMQAVHALTQTLTAENRGLKSQLGQLQRQVTSLRVQAARCGGDAVIPDTTGVKNSGERDHPLPWEEQLGKESSISEGEETFRKADGPRHPSDSQAIPQLAGLDLDLDERHVQSARSDDQGPLQVVVDNLAAKTNQLTSDLQALTSQHASDVQTLRAQVSAVQVAQGSTFVQWGSSTCSGSSDLVYSGAMGGSLYTHTGAAANALCLSLSPKLVTLSPGGYAQLYGAEYESYDSHMDTDPLCAVCRSHLPTTVMVPGTNVCESGWSLLYSGYLMAGGDGHPAASEFICVDSKLESAMHSHPNDNGHLLYYTKTFCGSLPCPPYENNKFVTCAVCSK